MRYEKILKRADGSRVRIVIELEIDTRKVDWKYTVDFCEHGKRTWIPAYDPNSYLFRKLSQQERLQFICDESLKRASREEIALAMTELWAKVRPMFLIEGKAQSAGGSK